MKCFNDTFNTIDDKIKYICNFEYNYFFNKANVQGIGLGYKVKNGFSSFEKCIKVFVSKKILKEDILKEDLIPTTYKGIKTDVFESGFMIIESLTDKVRPVPGGYNIGPISTDNSGTFGCLVTDSKYYYILSNNHILSYYGKVPLDTLIVQPSTKILTPDPENAIATLSKFIPLQMATTKSEPINYVDCAIAKITKRSQVYTQIAFIGRIKAITNATLGIDVQKVGSITELTYGKVTGLNVRCRIFGKKGEVCIFKNQVITTKMTEGGDSGSILLNMNMEAIGLGMSGSTTTTMFNPIKEVLSALNVQIVTR